MAAWLLSDKVLYSCSCLKTLPLQRLYFCRHCIKLRCPLCVSHEVDSYYCPNCLENMPSAEAKIKKNRCANCFDCPCCGNTLSTRATVAMPVDSTPEESSKNAKKVYYLACGCCRWTSRDVNIEDKTVASGGWQEKENPAAKRVQTFVDFYKQVAQKEKAEREKKKLARRRNFAHLAITSRLRKDRYGIMSLSRRKSSLAVMSSTGAKSQENPDQDLILKDTSVATEDVELLPDELYTKPLQLENVMNISQRLSQPDIQPGSAGELYPKHKHLLAKKSQRCRQCEHNLIKPEFNPSSIKFKIQLIALNYIPQVTISKVPDMYCGKEAQIVLVLTNPLETGLTLTLQDYEEWKEQKQQEFEESQNVKTEKEKSTEEKGDKEKGADEVTKEIEKKLNIQSLEENKSEKNTIKKLNLQEFDQTAKVKYPSTALSISAKDAAAEFDEEVPAENFNDDPRIVSWRQANRLGFILDVTPGKPFGDVKFTFVIKHEYHVAPALRGAPANDQPSTQLLEHIVHINLGAVIYA